MAVCTDEVRRIAKEWLRELEKGTSKDGHDQMPLRKVLYRHRNDVYDLPARVQRRGLSHSPCDWASRCAWHAHTDRTASSGRGSTSTARRRSAVL